MHNIESVLKSNMPHYLFKHLGDFSYDLSNVETPNVSLFGYEFPVSQLHYDYVTSTDTTSTTMISATLLLFTSNVNGMFSITYNLESGITKMVNFAF